MSEVGKKARNQHNSQDGQFSAARAAILPNMAYASERTLLEYIRQGSQAERKRAFSVLYDRYSEEIDSFIKSRISSEQEARAIFNEVWHISQDGWLNLVWPEQTKHELPLKHWLRTTAENKIKSYQRGEEPKSAVDFEEVGFFISKQEPSEAFFSDLEGSNASIESQKAAFEPDVSNNETKQSQKSTNIASFPDEGALKTPAAQPQSLVWKPWMVLQGLIFAALLILLIVGSRYSMGVTDSSAAERSAALDASPTATVPAISPTIESAAVESRPTVIITTTGRPKATSISLSTVSLPQPTRAPMAYPSRPISVENVENVIQLARWGKEAVNDIAYSPDGRRLALASSRGIYLYDSQLLRQVRLIESHSPVHSVVFSPDGQILAAGLSDHTVRLWRLGDGRLSKTLEGHTGVVKRLAFSANGQTLVSGSSDGTVQLWGLADGMRWHSTLEMEQPASSIEEMAFSQDGQILALSSSDGVLWVWRVSDRTLLYTLAGDTFRSKPIALSPDGQTLALGSADEVRLWQVSDGKPRHTLKRHSAQVERVLFSPNGQIVASSADDEVYLWRVSDGQRLHTLKGDGSLLSSMAFSPDGQTLASVSRENVRFWRVSDGTARRSLKEDRFWVECLALSPDGEILALGSVDGTLWLWRVSDGKRLHILEGHTFWVSSVTFSPDGQTLASSSHDGVRLWRVSDGQPLHSLQEHPYRALSVVFSPDGQTLLSGSRDGVRLWQLSDGQLLHLFKGHSAVVLSVAFSPDGQTQALGSREGIKLFRVSDGTLLHNLELKGHTSWVSSLVFTPDGQTLASVSPDGVRLWRTSDGKLLRTLAGKRVSSVAFSPDMQTLAWGADDGISLWRMSDGQRLHTLKTHTERVSSITFSPDGHLLTSGSHDGTVRLWGIPP